MSDVITVVLAALVILLWLLVIIRIVASRFAPEKTVKAQVVDKYTTSIPSKFYGAFKREKFVVVFLAEGKKYAFSVSQFSYSEYKINEKGTLRFKGSRLISFE